MCILTVVFVEAQILRHTVGKVLLFAFTNLRGIGLPIAAFSSVPFLAEEQKLHT
jgi:hypothetical protein